MAIKYFLIVFSINLFAIAYVWQNIEVMKLKMDYRKALVDERDINNRNDRLKYEIARFKRIDVIEEYARRVGMRKITPDDFDIIVTGKQSKR